MGAFRAWRRRLALGLPTVLGVARRGFFIPYRHANVIPPAGRRPPYRSIESVFNDRRAEFEAWLAVMDGFAGALEVIGADDPPAPRWTQDWFPRLDAAAAYAISRKTGPARIVEIGSGHSTRFFARAVADGALPTRITAIDPAPRADIAGLERVEILAGTVQMAGERPFANLRPGDILSIDSSHILMPGSDVDMLLNRILPALSTGILVHIHDIFLPEDYPAAWAWRGYNEQLGVAPLVLSGAWQVEFSSHYVASRMASRIRDTVVGRLPLSPGAHESGLWLKKG